MGICRDINALDPEMQKRTRATMKALEQAGIKAMVFETNRTQDVQDAYYAQGRQPLEDVNKLRAKAGLYLLTENENREIVTQTLKSRHTGGKAVDIVPLTASGKIYWKAPFSTWEAIGKIAEKNGLDWCYGGDGKAWQWDMPHYELMEDWQKESFAKEKKKYEIKKIAENALEN